MSNLLRTLARLVILATTVRLVGQAPDIQAKVSQEDGRSVIVATVKVDQKPVAGATLAFYVQRGFGDLKLGEDTTLEDGTAAVPLPRGLPPGADGKLTLKLAITSPAALAGPQKVLHLDGAFARHADAREDNPRSLWARRAPLFLLLLLTLIVGSVGSAYAVVVHHLFRIKKGDSHA